MWGWVSWDGSGCVFEGVGGWVSEYWTSGKHYANTHYKHKSSELNSVFQNSRHSAPGIRHNMHIVSLQHMLVHDI